MRKRVKRRSNQGFTIVELLATIVLLGVVLTIAILSFSSIQKSVREAQKENVLSSIKVAAKKYVNDRNVNKVYVETLIKEGFIQADDESQNIYAPDTNESLNCYYVDYSNEKEEIKQGSYNSETGTCNYDLISDAIISIKYCAVATGGTCANRDYRPVTGNWIDAKGKDIYLKVYNVPDFLDSATYQWISPLAPDIHYEGTTYKVEIPAKQFIDDVYQVVAYKDGKPYTAEARIRLDLKNPIVQDVLVPNFDGWATKKTLSATLIDNESTLRSYAVTQSTNVPTSGWKNISGSTYDIAKDIDSNGTWYIWVKDKAGNTNRDTIHQSSVEVDKIDSVPPTCINGGDNDEWTKNDVTITWGCHDDGSGCSATTPGGSKIFNTTTKTANIDSYKIKDNVGNETTCPVRTADVYVDKTAPSCTHSGDSKTWIGTERTIYYGCKDNESGCHESYSGESIKYNTTTKTAVIDAYIIKDTVGNSTNCKKRTANVYVDTTAPTCTKSGDSTNWTKTSRTITWGCNDGESGCDVKYDGDSKTFSTTTTTAKINSYTIKDTVGNTTTCEERVANVYVDTTAPTCTNSGDSTTWTNSSRTITWGCEDSNSGCDENNDGSSEKYSTTTKTSEIKKYTIKDKAGNSTTCKKRTANVYVDTTAPKVSGFTISSTKDYNSKYASITIKGSDDHSGVSKVCISSSNKSSKCSWKDFDGEYTTSYTFAAEDGSGEAYKLYAFIKDATGNVSSSKSASYTLYETCDETTVTGYGKWGACSEDCGGGYQYRDIYYEDKYFETTCPTAEDGDKSDEQCNTHSCCDEGEYEYTSCSDDGYKIYTRYNECIEDYESYTSKEGCSSEYYDCEWSACDEDGWKYKSCKYKKKGKVYTNSKVDKKACYTEYYDCDWGTCQSDGYKYQTCSYMYGGNEYEDPAADSELCLDKINGTRYDDDCNSYYITTCEPSTKSNAKCDYTKKNGVSSSGTIKRDKLKPSLPDSCNIDEEDLDVNKCDAYINSVSNGVIKYTISKACTVEDYGGGSCSENGFDDNYIKIGFNNISYGSSCSIWVDISGGTYTWNDNDYRQISWKTYKCSSSSGRGKDWYCTGSSESKACKKTTTACVKD